MEDVKTILANAVVRLLVPLARVLMRYEVSHSEFSELAKRAYVRAAYKYYSIPNRKNTYSRVSVLIGLNRKEVVRINLIPDELPPVTKGPLNRARQVICGWVSDPEFSSAAGKPKVLCLRGEVPNFEQLVARYSGDLSGRVVLDELVRVGAVKKIDAEHVELVHRAYIPDKSDSERLNILAKHTRDLLDTGVHNLLHEKDEARLQRQVTYLDLPPAVVKEFEQYSHEKSMDLLIDFSQWLAEKKATTQLKPGEHGERVGVGVYYFQNDNEEG